MEFHNSWEKIEKATATCFWWVRPLVNITISDIEQTHRIDPWKCVWLTAQIEAKVSSSSGNGSCITSGMPIYRTFLMRTVNICQRSSSININHTSVSMLLTAKPICLYLSPPIILLSACVWTVLPPENVRQRTQHNVYRSEFKWPACVLNNRLYCSKHKISISCASVSIQSNFRRNHWTPFSTPENIQLKETQWKVTREREKSTLNARMCSGRAEPNPKHGQ